MAITAYTDEKMLNGSDVLVYINTGTVEAPQLKAVAHSTSSQITNNAETKDRQTKDTGVWKKKRVVGLSVSVKCDALVSLDAAVCSYNDLLAKHKAGEPVYLKYGLKEEKAGDKFEEGWFIISSIDRTDAAAEDSSMSVSFDNTGAITTSTVSAQQPASAQQEGGA